jgi:integrase
LFREAATKYLEEETKKSLHNDAQALRALDPFIGDLYLEQVHSGTLEPFVKYMRGKSRKAGTINRYIAVVRRILNLAARYWRDADTGLSWLETAPLFRLEKGPQRKPYPISWEEQRLLLSELTPDLARMALFLINTGIRDQELCSLRWGWQQADDLFILPGQCSKNGEERFVVLNAIAQSVLSEQRGRHEHLVFPRTRVYSKGWKHGRGSSATCGFTICGTPSGAGFARRVGATKTEKTCWGTRMAISRPTTAGSKSTIYVKSWHRLRGQSPTKLLH